MYCFFNALQEKFEPQTKIGPLATSSRAPEGCPKPKIVGWLRWHPKCLQLWTPIILSKSFSGSFNGHFLECLWVFQVVVIFKRWWELWCWDSKVRYPICDPEKCFCFRPDRLQSGSPESGCKWSWFRSSCVSRVNSSGCNFAFFPIDVM